MGTPDDFLYVFVTEPAELPNGIQGYRVITQTNMTDVDKYKRHENVVIKRYSEFVRLRDKLSEEFPQITIPQAPDVVGSSAKSIEMQCRALDFFLKSLVSTSSSLYNSVSLQKFLVAETVAAADEEYGKCVPRMAARLSTDSEEILIFVDKMKAQKMAGNMVLLDGGNSLLHDATLKRCDQSGGSTCRVSGVPSSDGTDKVSYFCSISGLEERLRDKIKEGLRRATGLHVELSRKVYEGKVTKLQRNYIDDSNNTIRSISIDLATTEETRELLLGELYFDALEKVEVEDSIVIDIQSGAVKNKGPVTNTSSRTNSPDEPDLEAPIARGNNPQPGGEVLKMIKTAQNVSLHDLDEAITSQRKDEGIYSFLISQKVSAANIDEVVNNLVHEGLAKRKYGILQISEAQMLDFDCFSLINNALESSFLSVFLSAARGMCGFRGSEIFIPIKIPGVIFPRMIIIRAPNNEDAFGMATLFWYSNERQKLVTPVVDSLKRKDMINCVVLLAGPLQTGKSELAYQISKKLGSEDLFFPMIESDEYPVAELKKILKDTIRRAVSLKMRQKKKVYEGEVVEISSKATGSSSGINWQTTCEIVIGLKTDAKEQHFELDEQLSKAITKEQVAIGDVICIDFYNKVVTRIGRSPTFSEEKDHAKNVYVALPKGEILKEEKIQDITIYDLYKTGRRGHSICKLVRKEMNPKEPRSDAAINKAIESLVKQKVVQPQRGVLFIDQVDTLIFKI
ncbi:ruvB-like helicase 2 isoform X2 [Papaver somniferum]|uniref:ruvB-like helicase 2 isoform X2 n=1 Tax=Papaver somniferum TaxID=3469 RepID=UPI000E70218A|nr:ruvB-like helicase 2 isoform X2 [Papaver somniferum]